MSNYATPFLVLNLGSEMVYVIAQRLEAQNVPDDRTSLVLNEIISVLLSKQLMTEIMKPQPIYDHENVREIIEDVTQSSVMRLDNNSMNKLWDLITMIFKWQLTLSQDLIKVTLRHLYEIETYVTNPDTQLQLHKIQTLVENFDKILNQGEKNVMRDEILVWLKDYNVRVSLLMRMGLQNTNGGFVIDTTNPIAQSLLKNLGENIYAVTQNGKIMESASQEKPKRDVGELQLFVDEMLGDRRNSSSSVDNKFKLCIDDKTYEKKKKCVMFDKIEVTTQDNKLQELLEEMNLQEDLQMSNLKEDLLDMIAPAEKCLDE